MRLGHFKKIDFNIWCMAAWGKKEEDGGIFQENQLQHSFWGKKKEKEFLIF